MILGGQLRCKRAVFSAVLESDAKICLPGSVPEPVQTNVFVTGNGLKVVSKGFDRHLTQEETAVVESHYGGKRLSSGWLSNE